MPYQKGGVKEDAEKYKKKIRQTWGEINTALKENEETLKRVGETNERRLENSERLHKAILESESNQSGFYGSQVEPHNPNEYVSPPRPKPSFEHRVSFELTGILHTTQTSQFFDGYLKRAETSVSDPKAEKALRMEMVHEAVAQGCWDKNDAVKNVDTYLKAVKKVVDEIKKEG